MRSGNQVIGDRVVSGLRLERGVQGPEQRHQPEHGQHDRTDDAATARSSSEARPAGPGRGRPGRGGWRAVVIAASFRPEKSLNCSTETITMIAKNMYEIADA